MDRELNVILWVLCIISKDLRAVDRLEFSHSLRLAISKYKIERLAQKTCGLQKRQQVIQIWNDMKAGNRSQNFLCCCTDTLTFRAFSWSHLVPHLRQASVSSSGMFRRVGGFSLRQREMPVCSSQTTHQTPHYTVCFYMYVCAMEWKWTTNPERGHCQRRKRFVKWSETTHTLQTDKCECVKYKAFFISKKRNNFKSVCSTAPSLKHVRLYWGVLMLFTIKVAFESNVSTQIWCLK